MAYSLLGKGSPLFRNKHANQNGNGDSEKTGRTQARRRILLLLSQQILATLLR
jgi:hypothetical protein